MLIDARATNRISDSRLRPSHLLAITEEHPKMVSSAADSGASPTFLPRKTKCRSTSAILSLMSCFFFVCWKNFINLCRTLAIVLGESPLSTSMYWQSASDFLLMRNRRTI